MRTAHVDRPITPTPPWVDYRLARAGFFRIRVMEAAALDAIGSPRVQMRIRRCTKKLVIEEQAVDALLGWVAYQCGS